MSRTGSSSYPFDVSDRTRRAILGRLRTVDAPLRREGE
jgi:hypothetical protein